MDAHLKALASFLLTCWSAAAVGQIQVPSNELPPWLSQQIAEYEDRHPEVVPVIYRVTYLGKTAFHFFIPCCDRQNPLTDEAGGFICYATRGGDGGHVPATCRNGGRDPCTRVDLLWIHPKDDARNKEAALKIGGRMQWDVDDDIRCPNGLTP